MRLVARDDAEQVERAEAFVAAGAWVSHLVLLEAVWVLESVYGLRRREIAAWLQVILDHAQLAVQEPDVVAGTIKDYRNNARTDFADALILGVARRHGHLPFGSFDRKLSRLTDVQMV